MELWPRLATNACARSVGVALPKPSHILPSYGRTIFAGAVVAGSLTVLVFVVQTIIAMFQRGFESSDSGPLSQPAKPLHAFEVAAIPVTFMTLWLGRNFINQSRPSRNVSVSRSEIRAPWIDRFVHRFVVNRCVDWRHCSCPARKKTDGV